MRTLIFDHYEFKHPESEQGLKISIAGKHERFPDQFPDVAAFASSLLPKRARQLPSAIAFRDDIGPGFVRDYLQQYAGIVLPNPCDWPTYVLSNEWNDWDAFLVGPSLFIRFHWWTSA
jgi:hypothetical protein